MMLKDRNNGNVKMVGFVVSRTNDHDIEVGKVYPYGRDHDGQLVVLDGANDLQFMARLDCIILNDTTKLAIINTTYPTHQIFGGELVEYAETVYGRNINAGCVWVRSNAKDHDFFAVRSDKLTEYFPRWTGVAYRHRMQSVQPAKPVVEKAVPKVAAIAAQSMGGAPEFNFKPEEAITRYVTVEFSLGAKQYTYLLPNHLTAHVGDDAVVVVNNPNYPELKGTKVVRITGVYDRDPSDYDNGSLKRIEHVVSKSAERRKELEQKIKTKRNSLETAVKRVEKLEVELNELEQDLENENY